MKAKTLLSPEAVAEACGCGRTTVERAIAAGRLPAVSIVGSHGEVVAWGVGVRNMRAWDKARATGPGRPREGWDSTIYRGLKPWD